MAFKAYQKKKKSWLLKFVKSICDCVIAQLLNIMNNINYVELLSLGF